MNGLVHTGEPRQRRLSNRIYIENADALCRCHLGIG